jgi:hypothetical protein
MAKAKPAQLDESLIPRKGEAAPAVMSGSAEAGGRVQTIAVTVRLDEDRYTRLKVFGARTRRTNQDILLAALDAYFQKIDPSQELQGK